MEPLTVQQELHQLSMADLYAIQLYTQDTFGLQEDKDATLFELAGEEIERRIDLIKSKI